MKSGSLLSTSREHDHYCAICTSVLKDGELPTCPECDSARPPSGWPELDTSPFPFLGKILDNRYLLNQFLGDGATGYVYRAQAMQISRFFAAKIVDTRRYGKSEFEQELMRRFNLEVEAMSRLRNPHVVNIYEAMQIRDNLFVLLMDFVDGRTLQDLLDRVGRIKLKRALDIIRQVANGLYEAHVQGFIHRDLKPDNVMIERLPASGFFAKILDFGIVHMMDSASATQGFRGTPLYASPEQCTGDPNIDHRSDIYSLGCVFFHCVTGQPPFPGTESLKVMEAHVDDPPPLASEILPNSRIPEQLDDLLLRMLAKHPSDRPANLSEVIREIDELIAKVTEFERASSTASAKTVRDSSEVVSMDVQHAQRRETGELKAAPKPSASKSHSTRLVRPIAEFRFPGKVAREAGAFTATALNERGQLCAAADRLNRVHVMSLRNDGYFASFNGASGLITSVYVDSRSGYVYAAELDGTILRWKLDGDGDAAQRLGKLSDRVYAMSTDYLGEHVLLGTERGSVVALAIDTGDQNVLVPGGAPISAVAMCPHGNQLFVGYWGGKLEVINLGTGSSKAIDPLPSNPISMVVSDDGYVAAVLDEHFNVRILSLVHGNTFFEITAGDASLKAIAFDEHSQLLGMGIESMTVRLWDVRTQTAMAHLE